MRIFADKQSNKQILIQRLRHTLIHCGMWIVVERSNNICPHTDTQSIKQSLIQKLRPPYPLWSVDTPVAGQFFGIHNTDFFTIP